MRVKLLVSLAHPENPHNAGEEFECSDEEALRLIADSAAVPIAGAPREKAAKVPAPEKRSSKAEKEA